MSDKQPNDETDRALERITRESDSVLGSALARATDHLTAKDALRDGVAEDPAEVWGRRIGRALGVIFLVVLVVNLFTHWFF